MDKKDLQSGTDELITSFTNIKKRLNFAQKEIELKELEAQMSDSDFWQDKNKAEEIIKQMGELNSWLEEFYALDKQLIELETNQDTDLFYQAKRQLKKLEIATIFTNPYDKGDAVLTISAGAGGQDASDWAGMLFDMFVGYGQSHNFKTTIIDESLDEGSAKTASRPVKSITLEIKGLYAYGYLKNEAGVHRLVRISPYSAKKLRHTSFALVEVLPVFPDLDNNINIPDEDLKIDTFRSSGPGGQNVNKVETAVRLTHIPTGLASASQAGRSQSDNKAKALTLLKAKIFQLMTEQQAEEVSQLKTNVKPEWGSQIRSYVLHPYKMVKDHRTNTETSQVDEVLAGDLDQFIEAKLTASE